MGVKDMNRLTIENYATLRDIMAAEYVGSRKTDAEFAEIATQRAGFKVTRKNVSFLRVRMHLASEHDLRLADIAREKQAKKVAAAAKRLAAAAAKKLAAATEKGAVPAPTVDRLIQMGSQHHANGNGIEEILGRIESKLDRLLSDLYPGKIDVVDEHRMDG